MGINLRSVIKGAVFSLLTTLVLIFILSFIRYRNDKWFFIVNFE